MRAPLWGGRAAAFVLISLFSLSFAFTQETETNAAESVPQDNVDDLRKDIRDEAPEEFLGFTLKDTNVSLFLTGSWMGALQGNFGFSISPLGTGFAAPETPLLFKQEIDLSMSLWINNRWFVEANFLDDSKKNTYRAGYQGQNDEFIQYVGVGNTGLDYPSFPYLDLGGDAPSSFGFYSRLGGKDLKIHTLFRYDSASREEKVFSGGRERTYSYVQVENSIPGVSFVLPDTDIDSDIVVYIEDDEGALRDSGGRRWRLVQPSEYAAGRAQGLVDLNIRPGGMVAVSYSKGGDLRPWNNSMGTYSGSAGEFLYEVQQWFSSGRAGNLENYPQCGNGSGSGARPGEVVIGGVDALVVRQPGTFSPFERRSRYEAPSSTSEQTALVRLSNGTQIAGFQLVPIETSAASAEIPLFTAVVSRRGIYELIPENGGDKKRDPAACWPLAPDYPEIYLPGTNIFSGDIGIRFTNYGTAGAFLIGTDVVSGSIQVWRSGIQDANFSFNSSSGEVTLHGSVGANELIRISYLKQSNDTRLGSLAAGLGAVYRRGESPFSAMASIGIRWNLSEDSSFTQEGSSSPGTVGFSTKTAWDYDNLKAHISAGFALEKTDTTGLYRAAGMEGNETVLALPPDMSFLSNPPSSSLVTGLNSANRANLVYRNYTETGVLGSTIMPIDWSGSTLVSGVNRPYPAKDPQLNEAQALVAEFSLNDEKIWTGFQVPLLFDSWILSRASQIEIPYRLYDFSKDPMGNFKLVLQIGSLSGKDFAFYENINLVWEKELFASGDAFDTELRIARFVLREEDRIKLGNAGHLRLIAVFDGIGEEISGRVILSPPIVHGAAFRAVTYDSANGAVSGADDFFGKNMVTAVESLETSGAPLESFYSDTLSRLHPSLETQRVMKIEWENMEAGISAGMDGRIGELPLSDYKALSFFVKSPAAANAGTLSFIVASGPQTINEPILEAHIPFSAFRAGQWSKVTIRYRDMDTGISVDGGDATGATLRYRPSVRAVEGTVGKTGYIALLVNPHDAYAELNNGSVFIDEIILEDASMLYRANMGAAVLYKKPGAILSIRGVEVLGDFSVSNAVESELRIEGEENAGQPKGSVVNRTGAEISILGAKISGNFAFTAAKETFNWSADHSISKELGPFSVKETFYASPYDKASRHFFDINFDMQFYARFNAEANYELSRLERKWNAGTGYRSKKAFIPSVAVSAQALWTNLGETVGEDDNYAKLWAYSWKPMVPDLGAGADSRKTLTQIVITEATKPVGAVLTLEGSTNLTAANKTTALQNSVFLDVPAAFRNTTLNFRMGRKFTRHLNFSGDDALADGEKFFESIGDMLPLWGVFPGYSLFAEKLGGAMDKTLEKSPSFDLAQFTAFNDHFSLKAGLPSFYNLLAFLIPASASLRLERIIEQKLDIRSDMLNFGFSLGYSAVNMFGALGYLPLFKFYQNDEYTQAIEAAFIFPKGEDMVWRVQSVTGAAFNGFSGAKLKFVNTLILRSDERWLESFMAEWTIPMQKTLLSAFYEWIRAGAAKQNIGAGFSSLFKSNYEKMIKETLELVFDNNGDYLRWSVIAGHESIVRILGRLNLSAFIKLRCSEDTEMHVFTFDAIVGASLRLSF